MKYTYKEAFDKITEAYIKGEIKPFRNDFCFCGTLSHNCKWGVKYRIGEYPYTIEEYGRMEKALFSTFPDLRYIDIGFVQSTKKFDTFNMDKEYQKHYPDYEEFLFRGMCAALDVLKSIHIERGEIIDEQTTFVKREKQLI